jgi:hypothetical protein
MSGLAERLAREAYEAQGSAINALEMPIKLSAYDAAATAPITAAIRAALDEAARVVRGNQLIGQGAHRTAAHSASWNAAIDHVAAVIEGLK